jgi:SAM-dependent methyltransferase
MTQTDNFSNKINYIHNSGTHNFSAAEQILPFLLKLKNVDSMLDIGCGMGTWLAVASKLGVSEILGIDGIQLRESELTIPIKDFMKKNLTTPIRLDKRFDMVICLEVAEHLPETSADTLVDTLTNHGDFIVFSAAVPGQGGQYHINEQWPDYWQKLFFKKGYYPCEVLRDFFWDNEKIEWWYKQNILVFAPDKVLSDLNLKIETKVKSIVHPELYISKLEQIAANEKKNRTIKGALKTLAKSIIR